MGYMDYIMEEARDPVMGHTNCTMKEATEI
jgi:hypothetical protein